MVDATGRGADVAREMAPPIVGGMTVGMISLFVVSVVVCGYKEFRMQAGLADLHFGDADGSDRNSVETSSHEQDEMLPAA